MSTSQFQSTQKIWNLSRLRADTFNKLLYDRFVPINQLFENLTESILRKFELTTNFNFDKWNLISLNYHRLK